MELQLEPASYVVAVSGGVDSLALLHMLHAHNWAAYQARQPTTKLVVAHFDHGIRHDSDEDRKHVQAVAKAYGLPFVYDQGALGAGASEAEARRARYEFLRHVSRASNSRAIITAHHQDDLLETAILNLLRGTGRRGLTALSNRSDVRRPLLDVPKQQIIDYAQQAGISWREDSTNRNEDYLRNYIRHQILPRFDDESRAQLWQFIRNLQVINQELDGALINQLHMQSESGVLDRVWFNHLPHGVAKEVMASWLRAHGHAGYDSKGLERLVVAAKVATPGRLFPLSGGGSLHVGSRNLALVGSER